MTLNDVKEALGDDGVARMEQKLCEIEKNRSSKKTKDTEPQGEETVMPETGLQSSCFCVTTWYANPRDMFEIKPPRNYNFVSCLSEDAKGDDEDDPAVAACCQLLEELDAEEEEEDNKDEEKEGAAYSVLTF